MEDTNGIQQSDNLDVDYEYAVWKKEQKLRKSLDPLIDHMIIERGRAALWDVVDAIMKWLWTHKRGYMTAVINEVKKDRELVKNKFGSSGHGMRKLGSIPEELEILISRAYVEEITCNNKKFRHEFFKRYPQFRVAEKI